MTRDEILARLAFLEEQLRLLRQGLQAPLKPVQTRH
jgi:hypothetical protein